MKRNTWKVIKNILITIVVLALVGGVGAFALNMIRERNPDNLIKVNETYVKSGRLEYGIELDVNDDGVVRIKGNSSANEEIIVQTVTLEAGTYTISGINKPDLGVISLAAKYGDQIAYAGLDSDTFTIEAETVVTIVIQIGADKEISLANRVIKPCLVKGETAGDFYA